MLKFTIVFKSGAKVEMTSEYISTTRNTATGELTKLEYTDASENIPLYLKMTEVVGIFQNHIPEKKDKSRYVELPCEVGTTLYVLDVNDESCEGCKDYYPAYEIGDVCECNKQYPVFPGVEEYMQKKCCPKHTLEIRESKFSISNYEWTKREIGKTVFLTREEAEKELAERSGQ